MNSLSNGMILRHCTPTKNLESIIREKELNCKHSTRINSSDYGYVAFEIYNDSDTMVKIAKYTKKTDDITELFFDGNKLNKEGYKILKLEAPTKCENIVFKEAGFITEEEYNSIGDYCFIKSPVRLEYLTDDMKTKFGNLNRII